MTKKLKKKIYEYELVKNFLLSVGGDCATELVKICTNKKKPVTDEEIGEKLPLKITEIRTILNRLHYRGIACYQKTKNIKTGWYSYTWEIRTPRIAALILEQHVEEITKLEKDVEFEGTHAFFSSGKDGPVYPFEIAAEYDFRCPETGKPLKAIDNKRRVSKLKKKINLMKIEVTDLELAV